MDRTGLTPISINTLDFAEQLIDRTLGNADFQNWCEGVPNRNYDFGILFSTRDAANCRRGDRTDIRPNAMSASFEVKADGEPLSLKIIPSFWVYFRLHQRHNAPSAAAGDFWRPEIVWGPWDRRPPPNSDINPEMQLNEESRSIYLRTRYCQVFELTVPSNQVGTQAITLDLADYRRSRRALGSSPNWTGEIIVYTEPLPEGRLAVRLTLVNTYESSYPESSWFDVRMRVHTSHSLQETYCPLLDTSVRVQTVNCVAANREDSQPYEFEVAQINLAVRRRQRMRTAIPFEEASWENVEAAIRSFAADAADDHRRALQTGLEAVSGDQVAIRAMGVVLESFRRAMRIRAPDRSWYRFQLAILVLGAGEYLTGANELNPLVLNVPTAGGKTEAFTALALWSVAYVALSANPRWGTAVIKYPTKLLSSDQAERLAHYVLHFDTVLAEVSNGAEDRRGLGLFFGSDRENIDRLEVIGPVCPECRENWQVLPARNEAPKTVRCTNGHEVVIALQDEIFPRPPTLIVGTIDKFVSKNRKTEMGQILGRPIFWCPEKQLYVGRPCYPFGEHEHRQIQRRAELTTVILDEAHLLREEVGSLDSHFETLYLETARELSERYPLCVVSTATIAQAEEHCRQLGLGTPIMFPGTGRENFPIYYEVDESAIHHVVLSLMPRGRAIAWALPHLFKDYLLSHDEATAAGSDAWQHLKPAIIYCGSYATRNQTQNSIRRHVDTEDRKTRIGEFSRRRFNQAGMRREIENLADKDVVVSTNIASVGVDLGDLNAILYFGMPYNVNEFIQSMNRTGRRDPAIVCIVHNPYLERDAAFYAYMQPFLERPEQLVEAVPLNRYARRAIDFTFSTIAISQLQNIWGPPLRAQGVDLRRARSAYGNRGFREALGTQLRVNSVVNLLQRTYRSEGDPSGAYSGLVRRWWDGMASDISNYTPRGRGRPEFPYGDNWIWYAEGVPEAMYQLRLPDPMGTLEFTPEARRLAQANIRTIYGSDRDERENIYEEEIDIPDGALGDDPPEEGETE